MRNHFCREGIQTMATFTFNFFENLRCLFPKTKDDLDRAMTMSSRRHRIDRDRDRDRELDKRIYDVSRKYKISILPITNNIELENLYPVTDGVEMWNIFIVGCDKTYILANINDRHTFVPRKENLLNHQAQNIMPKELMTIFDNIWDKTLSGKQLQFYMVWNGKLYLINTYPFMNGKGKCIGAILFMRAFETLPERAGGRMSMEFNRVS